MKDISVGDIVDYVVVESLRRIDAHKLHEAGIEIARLRRELEDEKLIRDRFRALYTYPRSRRHSGAA